MNYTINKIDFTDENVLLQLCKKLVTVVYLEVTVEWITMGMSAQER